MARSPVAASQRRSQLRLQSQAQHQACTRPFPSGRQNRLCPERVQTLRVSLMAPILQTTGRAWTLAVKRLTEVPPLLPQATDQGARCPWTLSAGQILAPKSLGRLQWEKCCSVAAHKPVSVEHSQALVLTDLLDLQPPWQGLLWLWSAYWSATCLPAGRAIAAVQGLVCGVFC